MYSLIKNDPSSPRNSHLSVIAARDNYADEVSAIGWNNEPVNYNHPEQENYMERPKVTVHY